MSPRPATDISRRAVLRGLGVAMALPWLESLAPAALSSSRDGFPKRFAVLFMGNGVNGEHWTAHGSGADMRLGKTLSPLEPWKREINVVHGLFNPRSVGNGIHPAQTGGLLSGARVRKGTIIGAGVTVDQVIADSIGRDTLLPSIVLACERQITGYHETQFSMAYSSYLSWHTPCSPVPNEVYPSRAFDSLFANGCGFRDVSILDRVMEDAKSLERAIGAEDRAKLDEYLTSVRELEKRVDRLKGQAEGRPADRAVPPMQRPPSGMPEDLREHARAMCDIIAVAFQTDRTRVATLLLARDMSSLYYPFLDVSDGHHAVSHDSDSDAYESIVRFHVEQFAHLLERLAGMPEGDGTVLDSSCLVFLSSMWNGTTHDNSKLPLVLAGGLGGTLRTGRTLDYTQADEKNRKTCSLYLSIMDRMGVELDRFGDAETPLQGL